MHNIINCFLLLLSIMRIHCESRDYSNYTLYRGVPVKDNDLEFFKNISEMFEINYWRPPSTLFRPIEFTVAPEQKEKFLRESEERGVLLTTIMKDIQSEFNKQTVRSYIRRKMDTFNWQNFYRISDIYEWLHDLSAIYPEEMTVFSIGKTFEKRDIMAVKVHLKGAEAKSKIMIEGGIHAREWVSPAFVTYMINSIVHAKTSNNERLKKLAMAYEWYFVPVLNPDGYEYTHTQDRMWRKNRRYHDGHYGVDLNRNFDIGFGTVGISKNPSDEIFCGPNAFSEKESSAFADFIKKKSFNLEYYFAFHSYGQYLIIPYAHVKTHEENYDLVYKRCSEANKEIKRRYGTTYKVGTAYDTVGYVTSGVSGCWAKKTYKIPYVVTFELRDEGKYGFALPPEEIEPTCLETLDGVLNLIHPEEKGLPYTPQKYEYIDGSVRLYSFQSFVLLLCNLFFVNIILR